MLFGDSPLGHVAGQKLSGCASPTGSVPIPSPSPLPVHAGKPISTIGVKDWIYRLEEHCGMKETILGKMVRDMQTTFRVVEKALQVAGKQSLENIAKTSAFAKPAAVIIAIVGNLFYGTSLLTLTLIKSAIWIPMISFTCVAGGLGAMLGGALEGLGAKDATQGALDVFGYIGQFMGALAGFVVFLPSGMLHGTSLLGAALIQPSVCASCWRNYTEVNLKLLKALEQANPSEIPVRIKPLLLLKSGLDEEYLKNYFSWLDELGVDFNETRLFDDKQTALLLIQEAYIEGDRSRIWDQKSLALIQKSLKEANVWDKLFPETQKAIENVLETNGSMS